MPSNTFNPPHIFKHAQTQLYLSSTGTIVLAENFWRSSAAIRIAGNWVSYDVNV